MFSERKQIPVGEGWEVITLGKVVIFLEASRGQGQCPLFCFVGPTNEKVGNDDDS